MKKKDKQKSHNQEVPRSERLRKGRRDFFKKSWQALGIFAGLELIGVLSAFLFSGKSKTKFKPKRLIEAGSVNLFQVNSVTLFRGGRFYLARLRDGGFIALSLRCTHLGCSITWEEENSRFICPCHSSAFDIRGNVLNPPAPKALDYYPVLIENGIVKVDIGTKKERQRFTKEQLVYA